MSVKTKIQPGQVTIGMGASFGYGSDCNPYTVIAISASGLQLTLQQDEVMITGGDFYDQQEAVFLPSENGSITKARWNSYRERWMVGGKNGQAAGIGSRYYKRDPHF